MKILKHPEAARIEYEKGNATFAQLPVRERRNLFVDFFKWLFKL